MRNWALALAAAVVVIGCGGTNGGGGGGATGGGSTGTTGTAPNPPAVNLSATPGGPPNPGKIITAYLTGQGRAPGSPSAVIGHLYYTTPQNVGDGAVETVLSPSMVAQLDGYTYNARSLDVPISTSNNSRQFSNFYLQVDSLRVEGSAGDVPVSNGGLLGTFNLDARCFLGRDTAVQIYLDDAMLRVQGGAAVFDASLFTLVNYDPNTSTINSFLSDFVAFDISNVPSLPDMPGTAGTKATKLFFTGDQFGLGTGSNSGALQVLTPLGFIEGNYAFTAAPVNQGSFSLLQVDPRDPSLLARVTALQGRWRNYTDVLLGFGNFGFVSFPSSLDDSVQNGIIVVRSGNLITNLYYAYMDFATNTFQAWPVANLTQGTITDQIDGTLSNFVPRSGGSAGVIRDIRQGTFTITTATLPTGFFRTGQFVVFRA